MAKVKSEEKGTAEKPGRGRPRGSTSRRTLGDLLKVEEVMAKKDYDPIAALIDEARDEPDPEKRRQIHYSLLRYVYSKQPDVVQTPALDENGAAAAGGVTLTLKL